MSGNTLMWPSKSWRVRTRRAWRTRWCGRRRSCISWTTRTSCAWSAYARLSPSCWSWRWLPVGLSTSSFPARSMYLHRQLSPLFHLYMYIYIYSFIHTTRSMYLHRQLSPLFLFIHSYYKKFLFFLLHSIHPSAWGRDSKRRGGGGQSGT